MIFQIRPQSGVAFWVLLLGKKQVTFFCSLQNMKNFATNLFLCLSRSSRPDVFCKEGVYRNFTKFTGVFLWIFAKFLRTFFLTEHLRWLLLFIPFFIKIDYFRSNLSLILLIKVLLIKEACNVATWVYFSVYSVSISLWRYCQKKVLSKAGASEKKIKKVGMAI